MNENVGDENPYRTPDSEGSPPAKPTGHPSLEFSSPVQVTMRHGTRFPPRCVVCNEPADPKPLDFHLRRRLPLLVFIAIVLCIGPGIVIIIALATPKVLLRPGLCPQHQRAEVQKRRISVVLLLAFIGLLAAALLTPSNYFELQVTLGVAAFLMFCVAMTYALCRQTPIRIVKRSLNEITLAGLHPSVAKFIEDRSAVAAVESK